MTSLATEGKRVIKEAKQITGGDLKGLITILTALFAAWFFIEGRIAEAEQSATSKSAQALESVVKSQNKTLEKLNEKIDTGRVDFQLYVARGELDRLLAKPVAQRTVDDTSRIRNTQARIIRLEAQQRALDAKSTSP